jgi:hypothetical protein
MKRNPWNQTQILKILVLYSQVEVTSYPSYMRRDSTMGLGRTRKEKNRAGLFVCVSTGFLTLVGMLSRCRAAAGFTVILSTNYYKVAEFAHGMHDRVLIAEGLRASTTTSALPSGCTSFRVVRCSVVIMPHRYAHDNIKRAPSCQ